MEHKKSQDLEIPQPKQPHSVSIYTLRGEEDRKEGTQIGGRYSKTVQQEGGEISTVSNGIRFSWPSRFQTLCFPSQFQNLL